MIDQLNVQYYFNIKEFEGYKLIEWLYKNQLLSIKNTIFTNEISMEILSECNEKDFDDFEKHLKLYKSNKKIKRQNQNNKN